MVEELEEVSAGVAGRARVLEGELEVLQRHVPGGRLPTRVQGGVVQVALRAHDPVHARLPQAPLHVGEVLDVAVGEHGHGHGVPVGKGKGGGGRVVSGTERDF